MLLKKDKCSVGTDSFGCQFFFCILTLVPHRVNQEGCYEFTAGAVDSCVADMVTQ